MPHPQPVQTSPLATPAGLRERLRDATAESHGRLDARLAALDLTTLPGYRRFLEINAAALLPLESALGEAGVAEAFPDWPDRTRSRAILEDLAIVGGDLLPLRPPGPLDFGAMLGTIYVLEGSRLGAQHLVRIAERSPEPRVTEATTYLRHGAGHRLWRSFLATLGHHAAALRDDTAAIAGARRAFALFERAAA